jgi:ABC-type proline/glycine betaine transport system permease subunit
MKLHLNFYLIFLILFVCLAIAKKKQKLEIISTVQYIYQYILEYWPDYYLILLVVLTLLNYTLFISLNLTIAQKQQRMGIWWLCIMLYVLQLKSMLPLDISSPNHSLDTAPN